MRDTKIKSYPLSIKTKAYEINIETELVVRASLKRAASAMNVIDLDHSGSD
jgi:hypothetical protein